MTIIVPKIREIMECARAEQLERTDHIYRHLLLRARQPIARTPTKLRFAKTKKQGSALDYCATHLPVLQRNVRSFAS